jgi:hypothetical protein
LRRVEAGSQASGFTEKKPKIVIILERASFPKKKSAWIKMKQKGRIFIYNLSQKIADHYKLIEWVGYAAKEYMADRLFKSLEQLEFLWHQL